MNMAKIYPAIEFPVSRGTPMISPNIKWDHSEDWFVVKFESKISRSEKIVTVNTGDPEYEFVSGHLIDGKSRIFFYL